MTNEYDSQLPDRDPDETQEWREAVADVVQADGPERTDRLLRSVLQRARQLGVAVPPLTQTPYINTIAPHQQPEYPGDLQLEKRIRAIMRWNAVAMVSRANKRFSGIGGHNAAMAVLERSGRVPA